jgi:hypothetical protein
VNPLGPADSYLERWRLVLAALAIVVFIVLLGLLIALARSDSPAQASPPPSAAAAYSPMGSTDQPPSTVMVWPVTARASGESR